MKQHIAKKSDEKLKQAFAEYPRCAGVLLHITSLPSLFGIGDFGPKAYDFADFLQRSGQTIWQVLPINSSSSSQGFSPYGSDGTFAGNWLLISPEELIKEGWLSGKDINDNIIKGNAKTDYEKAVKTKTILLDTAYRNFAASHSKEEFKSFCKKEKEWLHSYALYILLKKLHEKKSWNQWEKKYKNYDKKALEILSNDYRENIDKIKWNQWIFSKQWFALKEYCNSIGIKIFGDLPFYVAYDSADVWTNQHLFKLDAGGNMQSESGAPPDDFNAEGQRWGMPVYNWNVAKKDGFDWWLRRLQKNIQTFDLLRLDHFRGFSAFWEIPVKAKSAKEGAWKPAPGKDLFTLLQNKNGSLPLVAEDLGTIDEPVILLRKHFNIPGMVIQQVGFGPDMSQSKSISHYHHHNSVVYTGNHDNNTTIGWFNTLSRELKQNIAIYTRQSVTINNVCDVMQHLVYSSVAKMAILPMQDILQLDEDSRMNSVPDGGASWSWRMAENALTPKIEAYLNELCSLYDRAGK